MHKWHVDQQRYLTNRPANQQHAEDTQPLCRHLKSENQSTVWDDLDQNRLLIMLFSFFSWFLLNTHKYCYFNTWWNTSVIDYYIHICVLSKDFLKDSPKFPARRALCTEPWKFVYNFQNRQKHNECTSVVFNSCVISVKYW